VLTFGGKPYRESVGVGHGVGSIRCFFLNNPHIAGESEHTTVGLDFPVLSRRLALAVLFVKLRKPRALQNSRIIFSITMLSLRGEQKTNPIFIAAADSDTLNVIILAFRLSRCLSGRVGRVKSSIQPEAQTNQCEQGKCKPARTRSRMFRAPMGSRASFMANNPLIEASRITTTISAANASADVVWG